LTGREFKPQDLSPGKTIESDVGQSVERKRVRKSHVTVVNRERRPGVPTGLAAQFQIENAVLGQATREVERRIDCQIAVSVDDQLARAAGQGTAGHGGDAAEGCDDDPTRLDRVRPRKYSRHGRTESKGIGCEASRNATTSRDVRV